ncbi:MAG: DNA replication/repair protein RecF [Gemmatimonadales bacterium]
MRAERIVARGFRNLADLDLPLPPGGAVFQGPNGHGKTNLLELLYYPVLFRSLRDARDVEVVCHGGDGFRLALSVTGRPDGKTAAGYEELTAEFQNDGKHKRVTLDRTVASRMSDAIGHWLAVAFMPADLGLVQGSAAGRRRYLDRVLALADREYLRCLTRYRRALAQRNAALKQAEPAVAAAFDGPLAAAGADLVRRRIAWVRESAGQFAAEGEALGEPLPATLRYRGDDSLGDPAAWPAALGHAATLDQRLGMTTVGPHRHDLDLRLGNRPMRAFGSTGQQRTAAIALKLCERNTLARATGNGPALLLDDVFAELDGDRRRHLADRLARNGDTPVAQTFLTAARGDELPEAFHLEPFQVEAGRVRPLAPRSRVVA